MKNLDENLKIIMSVTNINQEEANKLKENCINMASILGTSSSHILESALSAVASFNIEKSRKIQYQNGEFHTYMNKGEKNPCRCGSNCYHLESDNKIANGVFNGVILYSDTVTMDSAYKSITGKTKAESEQANREWLENRKKQEREHEEQTPRLIEEWKLKGRSVLSIDKWEYWDKIVPIRVRDLYKGMELGECLKIVKILNNGGTLDEAKMEIESQDHSGMSFGLVCSMVREFCDRGQEFVDYVK